MPKQTRIKLNQKILRDQGVGLVLLFGSQITGSRHPKSDIDIGIVFSDFSHKQKKPVEVYGSLHEELVKKFKNENIDIAYLQETPLSLQYKAVRDGIILYEKNPPFFADYKEKVLKKYFDFQFFENIFKQAIISA